MVLTTIVVVAVLVGGVVALDSGPVSPAQAQSGPTEISNWTDLNDTRTDLSGDYVLVNDLNASTPGYDAVVANRTATKFSEERSGSFDQGDTVTLTRTPLDSVTATNDSGVSVNVTITDSANGTVEFQENPDNGFPGITFDYVTGQKQFVGFDPIGEFGLEEEFNGTFGGQGNTIADLRINRPTERSVGLFSETDTGGNLINISITNATVTGNNDVGVLVGVNAGNVTGSQASGSVTSATDSFGRAGGLVGVNDGNVTASQASGSVNGYRAVGGLVGDNFGGTVTGSAANGSVNGGSNVGGLVGRNLANVTESVASGSVNGSTRVGGLVGDNTFEGTVTESTANDSVTGENEVGGLVGKKFNAIVTESAASGSANGFIQAGGLVGANRDTVTESQASGSVTGSIQVGGLVGQHGQRTLSESFAVGNVTGGFDVGGLVGQLGTSNLDPGEEAIVRDVYFDNQTTGQSAAVVTIDEGDGTAETRGEVTSLTTSQMQGESAETTMSAFDFQNTWTTVTSPDDYPTLREVTGPPSLPSSDEPPRDPNGDGVYEDIDGDSEFDIFDVQALFNGLDSDAVQNNPEAFNFNGDNNPEGVSIFNVQGLFEQLSGD